jgi:hypothetical protein
MIDPNSRHGRELKAAEEFFALAKTTPVTFNAWLLSARRRAVPFFEGRIKTGRKAWPVEPPSIFSAAQERG